MLTRFKRAKPLLLISGLAAFALVALPQAAIASTSFTYDAAGRLTSARYGNGVCISYSYDANGNRTAQTNASSGGTPALIWGSGTWGCFSWAP
jgi:YD repeat-containing protein